MYQKTEENTDQAKIRDIENVSSSDSKVGGVGVEQCWPSSRSHKYINSGLNEHTGIPEEMARQG